MRTDHPREVIEAALAHVVQNLVEAAYARSDLFERRRVLMNDWARYLARGPGRIRSPWSKESQGMGCPHQVWQGDLARGRPGRESGSKPCGKTFSVLNDTALSGLHHKEPGLSFETSLAEGETFKASAERYRIAPSTAHRWRHRFPTAVRRAPTGLVARPPYGLSYRHATEGKLLAELQSQLKAPSRI